MRALLADPSGDPKAPLSLRIVPRAELPEETRALTDEAGFLRCWPHRHDTDGFFAVRFERVEESTTETETDE